MKASLLPKELDRQMRVLEHPDTSGRPFTTCSLLASHAMELVDREQEPELRSCFGRMLRIYAGSRSAQVKTAIENVFLYHISTSILLSSKRRWLLGLLPPAFRQLLDRQVTSFGI
jgi:hypothetical protein